MGICVSDGKWVVVICMNSISNEMYKFLAMYKKKIIKPLQFCIMRTRLIISRPPALLAVSAPRLPSISVCCVF